MTPRRRGGDEIGEMLLVHSEDEISQQSSGPVKDGPLKINVL